MGKMAQSLRQMSLKYLPSDIDTNPKQCVAVTLRSGRELDGSIEVKTSCNRN